MCDPLDENIKLYMNHCHRDPVNIFFINMRNSLFRLLILFDVFDELQEVISKTKLVNLAYLEIFGTPFKFSAHLHATKPRSAQLKSTFNDFEVQILYIFKLCIYILKAVYKYTLAK